MGEMQFVDIVPFLDVEIERLQAARDLLATFSIAFNIPAEIAAAPVPVRDYKSQAKLPGIVHAIVDAARVDATKVDAARKEESPSVLPQLAPAIAAADVPVQRLRPHQPRQARRATRKALAAQESALRGVVPAGPVVVSPDVLRKEQAWKAQPAPAEQIKVPVWSGPSSDSRREARSLDAMLQRLMDMGSSDEKKLDQAAVRHG
jgi:hypothetical protein